jgi:hypothetical protein
MGHPVVFIKLKENKIVSGFKQNDIIYFLNRHVSVNRPSSGHVSCNTKFCEDGLMMVN